MVAAFLFATIYFQIVTLAKFNYKNIAQNKYFCAKSFIFAELSLLLRMRN